VRIGMALLNYSYFEKNKIPSSYVNDHYYFTIEATHWDDEYNNESPLNQETLGVGIMKKLIDEEREYFKNLASTNPDLFNKIKSNWLEDYPYVFNENEILNEEENEISNEEGNNIEEIIDEEEKEGNRLQQLEKELENLSSLTLREIKSLITKYNIVTQNN
jgi:hypothetical protein